MYLVITALALLAVIVAMVLYNAYLLKPLAPSKTFEVSPIKDADKAVDNFRELLKLPTIYRLKDPNADRSIFKKVLPLLKKMYPNVFKTMEYEQIEDYGISLLWKGENSELAPILLMSHHDVVEADPDGWTHDPFAAEIEDGNIYARGSIDTKCILSGFLEAAERLCVEGFVPPRDIILFSPCNEEDAGPCAPSMVNHLKEIGRVPYMVIDEGGAIIDNPPLGIQKKVAMVGVSEKGIFNARIKTTSAGGHASMPSKDDAAAKLVSSLDYILKHPAKPKISAPIEAMLVALGRHANFGLKIAMGNIWLFKPLIAKIMAGGHEASAMVRTTYALTQLEGSLAHNIISNSAKATLNVRVDPQESVEIALKRITDRFDSTTEIETFEVNEPSPVSPFKNDKAFNYLSNIITSVYPDAAVAPYVQSSASDARHFAKVCPHTYRFAGFLFSGDERTRAHGQDEHIGVEEFKQGVQFYYEFMRHLSEM